MTKNYNLPVAYSLGTELNLGKARRVDETWEKLVDRFREPTVTQEKFAEYVNFSDQRQKQLKGTAGWFMRTTLDKGKRNKSSIEPGNILTLDMDYVSPAFYEKLKAGKVLRGTLLFWHTTRSHTPEKPKVRMVIRTKQRVGKERFGAVTRILSAKIGISFIDKVSARMAQMMYMPTVSKDMKSHFGFYEQGGNPLDVDKLVGDWEEDNESSTNISALPLFPGEKQLRHIQEKAEDPLTKEGMVGDFCRAWSISELIEGKVLDSGKHVEGPLAEMYEIVEWQEGVPTRATYLHGTSSHGAVIYDDKFMYSHHGSDPAQEQLCNAYDLARIHLFGDEDKLDDEETPIMKRPSAKAMTEWLKDDDFYKEQRINSRYDFDAMFSDAGIEEEPEPEIPEKEEDEDDSDWFRKLEESGLYEEEEREWAEKPPKNWVATELNLTQAGDIRSDTNNIAVICKNDARLFRKIGFNEFTQEVVILDDIRTKNPHVKPIICKDRVNGDPWVAAYDNKLHALLSAPNGQGKTGYGIKAAEGDLFRGLKVAAEANSFHPIKEFLKKCNAEHPDDGTDYIRDFPSKYLLTADDAYHREAFANMLIGSVARVHEPGCKFDYMLILQGEQGTGKSTFVEMLYGAYFMVMDADLHDRRACAEQTMGSWGMEMGELDKLKKAEVTAAKAFLSRTDDTVRLAYDRSNTKLLRQTVFWGTSNEDTPLRDRSGNRRYWPFKIGLTRNRKLAFDEVAEIIPKMWAQAYREYLALRSVKRTRADIDFSLKGEAMEMAVKAQEGARSQEAAEQWADVIENWFEEEIKLVDVIRYFDPDALGEEFAYGEPDGWNKSWGDYQTKVRRLAAQQEDLLTDALGFRAKAITPGQQITWNDCKDVLQKRGYIFSTTKGSSDGRMKAPRLGAEWINGGGMQKSWVLPPDWAKHNLRVGYRSVADAHESESDDMAPVDDDLI